MYIRKYIQLFGILSALFLTTACGKDKPSEGNTPIRTITTHLSEFQVEGESAPLPGEGEIYDLQACLFEDGLMTEIYTQFTQQNDQYVFQTSKRAGHLYILANIADQLNIQELKAQGITEEEWQQITLAHADDYIQAPEFFSGMIDLGQTDENLLHLDLERGIARFDLSIQSSSPVKVNKVVFKNITQHTFLFPQNPVTIPAHAEIKDRSVEFAEGLGTNTQGIFYMYEQAGDNLKASLEIVKDEKEITLETILPSTLKRNVVYTLEISTDSATGETKLNVIEWKNGGDHILSSDLASIKVDTEESILPDNVTVNEEKTQITLPYTSTDMTLVIDCDDELELISENNMPIKITSLGGLRPETIGKNVFRIQKEKWRPGVPETEVKLRFHRKGLLHDYAEDALTLVLSENPIKLEGLIHFHDGYEFDFGRYIDNELGLITLPASKKLTVEYESGEGHWIKLDEQDETPNSFRIIGGWKPNDPTANGRKQKATLVICNTDGTDREEYTVVRRNWGLPVTYLNGVWWCKYNAMGDSKNFNDQILSSNDPAAKAGKTLFDYLRDCTPEEFFKLWKWQYQGKTTQGMEVIDDGGVAKMEGYGPSSEHINKLDATAMAPDGYELPSMENFERIWVPTEGIIWLMWDGSHTTTWNGGSNIQRRQRRRNDITVGTVALSDLIYIQMYNNAEQQYEPLVWYGPGAQWNNDGIQHDHYNAMLWATYSPSNGQGWFYTGTMKGLYPSKNGAGPNDTRLLRFKKSDVEYIYE